ncbi:MAG: hypothetical protein ACE1ZA_17615, partial [Pseudomonadales bacterium]
MARIDNPPYLELLSSYMRCPIVTLIPMAVLLLVSVGCQSVPTIDAAALPPQYDIGLRAYKPAIDLSRLARRAVDSDIIYRGDMLDVTVITGA